MDSSLFPVITERTQEVHTVVEELACGRKLGVIAYAWSLMEFRIRHGQHAGGEHDGVLEERKARDLVLGENLGRVAANLGGHRSRSRVSASITRATTSRSTSLRFLRAVSRSAAAARRSRSRIAPRVAS